MDGPDRSFGQQQASVPTVQSRDERALFDEVLLPHMAEAYRLAHWLIGNAYEAEDVVQERRCARFAVPNVSVPSMLECGP